MRFFFILLFIFTCTLFCTRDKKPKSSEDHIKAINSWHEDRVEALTSESSWLTLAGLFWLTEGQNRFGSGKANDIDFPKGKAPENMGVFILSNGQVTVKIDPGIIVLHNNGPVSEMIMENDSHGEPTILTFNTLSWYIIQRGDRYGVRLKDSAAKTRTEFAGIQRFQVDSTFRVIANFVPYDSTKNINIPTQAGPSVEHSPGLLEFEIGTHKLTLGPLGDLNSDQFFIIFGDETNGKETYGGGRFLYVDNPGKAGKVEIDFNKAYNPPCVFTPFATCPLPPEQNKLPIDIAAGEKVYGH